MCRELDASFSTLEGAAEVLTPYAWESRYPNGPEQPSLEAVHTALRLARQISEAVLLRLPSELRP